MAPGAKLAVLDLGTSDQLEQALGGTMWEVSAGTGARIHSASWGFIEEICTVDESAVSFDEWAYEVRGWVGACCLRACGRGLRTCEARYWMMEDGSACVAYVLPGAPSCCCCVHCFPNPSTTLFV